jgi:hypothetical protein
MGTMHRSTTIPPISSVDVAKEKRGSEGTTQTRPINDCFNGQCSFVALCLNQTERRGDGSSVPQCDEKIRSVLELMDQLQEEKPIFDRLNAFKQQQFDILHELKYADINPDRCYRVGRTI